MQSLTRKGAICPFFSWNKVDSMLFRALDIAMGWGGSGWIALERNLSRRWTFRLEPTAKGIWE